MTTADIPELTVTEAVAALGRKEFTPAEYVEALVERQSRWPTLNAYTQQDPEGARKAAANPAPGPLSGIPVAIKDNVDVAGYCTTAGTPGLKDHRPKGNAPVVQKVLDSGAIVMGKLGLHEMAAGGTCANITFGPVRNPYDLARVPGGSSGGSGAAVAARLVPAALGTDTAGSVRAPAAMCGVVGFRPTTGRYSRVGLVPGDLRRDTMGWLARSVADVILLDGISAVTPPAQASPVSLRGLRLGVPRDFFYEDLDPELAEVVDAALKALTGAGVELVEVAVPELRALMTAATAVRASQVHSLSVYLAESGGTVRPEDIIHSVADAQLRAGMERGLGANNPAEPDESGTKALQAAYSAYFRDNNLAAMVFPTVPEPAYLAPEDYLAGGTGPTAMIRNTLPGARTGLPGLTVPAGLTTGGLPVGLEFDGPAGADAAILEIGRAFEAIIPPLPAPKASIPA